MTSQDDVNQAEISEKLATELDQAIGNVLETTPINPHLLDFPSWVDEYGIEREE